MIDLPLPADLTDRTVLDLGGYGGEHARQCLARGAVRATVVDNQEYKEYGWSHPDEYEPDFRPQPGSLDERLRFVRSDLIDWHEPGDLVICSNVIYHLRDPFAALRHIRTLTLWRLLVRTSFLGQAEVSPDGWWWYPNGTGHPNGTVWCRPSPDALYRALEGAGFTSVTERGRAGDHIVYEAE